MQKQGNFNSDYQSLLAKVKEGMPIYKAAKAIGLNRSYFYRNMSDIQRKEIEAIVCISRASEYHRGIRNAKIYDREDLYLEEDL